MKLFSAALAFGVAFSTLARGADSDWRGELSPETPGKFAPLPSVRMKVRFGWSNVLQAAEAEATIRRKGDIYVAHVNGKTDGLARTLWPLDAQHSAAVSATSLHATRTAQLERYRKRSIDTQVNFDDRGLQRLRKTTDSQSPAKWKRFEFAPIYDVIGGVLFVRSQPLRVGDKVGLVCFPGDSPYVVVVRVQKKETIRAMGKDVPALRLSLTVRKLETKKGIPTDAVPYSKFRSGTVWVSDDDLRLPLRAEVNVMIGFVYAELAGYDRL